MGEDGGDVAARLMTHGQQVLSGIRNSPQPRQGTDDTVTQLHVEFQEPRTKEYRELRNALTQLSNRLQVLPTVKDLNGLVKREGDCSVSGGTYSDVWMGTCLGRKVALKALREVRTTAKKAVKVRSHKHRVRHYTGPNVIAIREGSGSMVEVGASQYSSILRNCNRYWELLANRLAMAKQWESSRVSSLCDPIA